MRGDNSATNFAATLTQRLGYGVAPGSSTVSAADRNPNNNYLARLRLTTSRAVRVSGRGWAGDPPSCVVSGRRANVEVHPEPNRKLRDGSPIFSTTAEKTNVRDDKFGVKVDINKFGNWSVYWHFDDSQLSEPLSCIHLKRAGIFRSHRFSRPADQREQYSRHKPQHGQRTASELHSVCLLEEQTRGRAGSDHGLWLCPGRAGNQSGESRYRRE